MSVATAERIYNFSAGPAVLPDPVLRQAQEDLWNLAGSGIGVLEHSHRGAAITHVLEEAEADCRAIAGISDDSAERMAAAHCGDHGWQRTLG